MTTTCKNCDNTVEGKFCSSCGQAADTHRISTHFLWHDIQHGLLHVDKGILFTAKELFTRPGHSIREFLEGKRVKHFKPLSMVLILAGVYGFLSHYFHINILANNIEVNGTGEEADKMRNVVASSGEWLAQHYSLFTLFQVPAFSIGTWLCFKKAGYNFIEHFVINTYLASQRLILRIAVFPLYYAFNNTPGLRTFARITDLIGFVLIFWSLYQLFNNLPRWQRIVRAAGSCIIAVLIIFVIMFFVFMKVLGL